MITGILIPFCFPVLFSCEGAALEVLMYVCPSVCLSVRVQVEILALLRVPECSRMFQNIPEF